ncbi:MAG: hypothetical protein WD272_10240 [Balneolales bacterium]
MAEFPDTHKHINKLIDAILKIENSGACKETPDKPGKAFTERKQVLIAHRRDSM